MIDPKRLRNETQQVADQLRKKHFQLNTQEYNCLEQSRKQLQIETEHLQAERNKGAKAIGQAKGRGENVDRLTTDMHRINDRLERSKTQLTAVQQQLEQIELHIPNLPDPVVPEGKDENDNRFIRKYGTPPDFTFDTRDHVDLAGELADFATASKLSGSRFAVLVGKVAQMHRALTQFMVDMHINKHGYTEYYLPYLVHPHVLTGAGQLPKFTEDQFHIDQDDMYLIPTAEPALVNMVRDTTLKADDLPLKMVAHTPCFRREAGSYGRDTRGMFRQHQFDKVELVQITKPQQSEQALEEMTMQAEAVLQALAIPYRVVELCGGDLGFGAVRTYDIEVWLPGQNSYREISSISNCRDFQARRMKTRWNNPETGATELVHTLNGSAVAVGRALIAVLENYQQKDGSVTVPDALRTYMPAIERI